MDPAGVWKAPKAESDARFFQSFRDVGNTLRQKRAMAEVGGREPARREEHHHRFAQLVGRLHRASAGLSMPRCARCIQYTTQARLGSRAAYGDSRVQREFQKCVHFLVSGKNQPEARSVGLTTDAAECGGDAVRREPIGGLLRPLRRQPAPRPGRRALRGCGLRARL
jgi:hypothetical protein